MNITPFPMTRLLLVDGLRRFDMEVPEAGLLLFAELIDSLSNEEWKDVGAHAVAFVDVAPERVRHSEASARKRLCALAQNVLGGSWEPLRQRLHSHVTGVAIALVHSEELGRSRVSVQAVVDLADMLVAAFAERIVAAYVTPAERNGPCSTTYQRLFLEARHRALQLAAA